jgi:predicted ribosome quality control (RQC) complex YloA/Tae2 family protein
MAESNPTWTDDEKAQSPARRKLNEFVGFGRESRDRHMQMTEPARLRERASGLRLSASRNEHRAAKLETSMERHHHAAAQLEEKRVKEQGRLRDLEAQLEDKKGQTAPTAAESEPHAPHPTRVSDARGRLDRQKLRQRVAAQRRKVADLENRINEHRTAAENRRVTAQQLQANAQRDAREAESVDRQAEQSRGPEQAPPPRASPRLRT